MSRKSVGGDLDLSADISDDIIAEALRSVEKHSRRESSEGDDNAFDDESLLEEETFEDIIVPAELDDGFIDVLDPPTEMEVLSQAVGGQATSPPAVEPRVDPDKVRLTEKLSRLETKLGSAHQLVDHLKARVIELNQELEILEEALKEKTGEAKKHYDRLLWTNADLENLRKRTAREKAETERYGNEKLLREILPVVDNLERALTHAAEKPELPVLEEGVRMTLTQFANCLKRFSVERIPVEPGTPFDPAVHEAMMHEESEDVPANTIVREFVAGYLLRDRLLRASLVTVARAPQPKVVVDPDGEVTREIEGGQDTVDSPSGDGQGVGVEGADGPAKAHAESSDGADVSSLAEANARASEDGPSDSSRDAAEDLSEDGWADTSEDGAEGVKTSRDGDPPGVSADKGPVPVVEDVEEVVVSSDEGDEGSGECESSPGSWAVPGSGGLLDEGEEEGPNSEA